MVLHADNACINMDMERIKEYQVSKMVLKKGKKADSLINGIAVENNQ
jgi:hypothetical protein